MTLAGAALLVLVMGAPSPRPEDVHLDGYAEWREGAFLVVDGQRVRLAPDGRLSGHEKARTFADIPLGYEIRVDGGRLSDGTVSARHLDARPNEMAMFEGLIQEATDEAEARYRRFGQIFDESSGRMKTVGKLESEGPRVDRVRGVVTQLLPPYVDPARVRVYVVDNKEWNAFAMGNYAIFVYGGLLQDVSDDELAIVLGHELVHATHEHTRREMKREMWIQLAAAGAAGAASTIDSKTKRTVTQVVSALAASAWSNGYGRNMEDQADRVGLRYAYEGGYDISRGPALWGRFAEKYGRGNAVTNFFFSDHSRSLARAANLRQEIALNYRDGPRTAGSVPRRVPPPAPAPMPVPAPALAPAKEAASVAGARALAITASSASTSHHPATEHSEIHAGMGPADVRSILGEPAEELVFERRTRWLFLDCTVIFQDGKVVEVRF